VKVLLGRDEMPDERFSLRLLWEPRDLWFGVFWNRAHAGGLRDRFLFVYVCVLPCVPIVFAWRLSS
jgi:hypothetical protein